MHAVWARLRVALTSEAQSLAALVSGLDARPLGTADVAAELPAQLP